MFFASGREGDGGQVAAIGERSIPDAGRGGEDEADVGAGRADSLCDPPDGHRVAVGVGHRHLAGDPRGGERLELRRGADLVFFHPIAVRHATNRVALGADVLFVRNHKIQVSVPE